MGAHYSSIQIRSEDRAAVKTAVEVVAREFKKKFLLGPVLDGWIAIYPDDAGNNESCAAALAKRLESIVLHLEVYDSDIFFYNLFQDGRLSNEYSSDPDHFEEVAADEHERLKARPELFQELMSSPENLADLTRLLKRGDGAMDFDFEEFRLEKFAKLLGIRNALTSYQYFTRGEHEGLKYWKDFIHIPDQNGEKAARKAAETALRAEKQRLQNEGLLYVEILPPGNKKQRIRARGEFCLDPAGGGLLLLWNTPIGERQTPQLLSFQKPWTSKPQTLEVDFPRLYQSSMVMSKSGRWLAFYDTHLRLWDWHQRRLIDGIRTSGAPVLFSDDEKLLLCHSQQKFDLISLEALQPVTTFLAQSAMQTLHPSNTFLVTRPAQEKLGILNLANGKLENTLFCGKKMDGSHLATFFEDTIKKVGLGAQEFADWKTAFIRGTEQVFRMRFSPDGQRLFCATTAGVRVFAWDELFHAVETTPRPLFAFTLHPDAITTPGPNDRHYANYVYDVIFDEPQNRLLFGGIEGPIRFLDLADGSSGILFDPPGKSSICKLQLSADRESLCCLSIPKLEERDDKEFRIQIWNYPALCRRVGLSF